MKTVSWVALAAISAALIVLPASAASAHDQLLSSSPADGERLAAAPTEVTLQFSSDILTMGAVVLVVDEAGTNWAFGDTELVGQDVTVAVTEGMPDAGYQVRWRVVSSDGHPISGLIPFTVGDGTPYTQADGVHTDGSTPEPSAEDQATAEQGTLQRVLLIGGAGAAVAVLAFALSTIIGRRRSTTAHSSKEKK